MADRIARIDHQAAALARLRQQWHRRRQPHCKVVTTVVAGVVHEPLP
ncbi:MAG: hypothetical protein ABSA14_13885 [Acidimicrobiales bacterium]